MDQRQLLGGVRPRPGHRNIEAVDGRADQSTAVSEDVLLNCCAWPSAKGTSNSPARQQDTSIPLQLPNHVFALKTYPSSLVPDGPTPSL